MLFLGRSLLAKKMAGKIARKVALKAPSDLQHETGKGYKYDDYTESGCETRAVSCIGVCLCLTLGLLVLAYFFNSLHVDNAEQENTPPFSKSLLWLSIAHHTDAWNDWKRENTPPPPTPRFTEQLT
jgi:hypothetical protein